jgi:hypothetical protein
MKTNIIVTLQIDAIHNWPGVVEHNELSQVDFLQYPHRHMFHITAKKAVTHDDRDIEIIMFKRNILDYLHRRYFNKSKNTHLLGSTSCEMLAKELTKVFSLSYCEVLEDNENGAEVYSDAVYTPTEVVDGDTVVINPIEWSVTGNTDNVQLNYTYKSGSISL